MTISAIGGIMNAAGLASTSAVQQPGATAATGASAPASSTGNAFVDALDNVQSAQDNADSLAKAAATGNLSDIHNYTIAATEASLTTELTVAVRDRAVEAFNEIMRMQI